VVAGLVPALAVAQRLCQRGFELAESACKPHELVYVLQHNSVYQMTVGAWERADAQLRRGIAIAERSGDRRPLEESSMMLSIVCSHRGRCEEAYRVARDTLTAARQRGDGQILFWGAMLQTMNALRLGMDVGPELLEASLPWIESSGMEPEMVNAAGHLARVYLLRGERDKAVAQVEKALALVSGKRPVAYWTHDAVEAVAEVTSVLREGASSAPAEERARLDKLAERAWKELWTFAQVFPFGKPAAWLWRGVDEIDHGHTRRGRRAIESAIAEAERLSMPYERARAHYELGRRSKGLERTRHLMRAIEFFAEAGAKPDLRRAEEALKQRV
jgi:tetratricopeptide (TPR) repeat protein